MRSQYGGHSTGNPLILLLAAALSAAFVTVQPAPVFAQSQVLSPAKLARDGYALTKNEAENIESLLRNKPDDLAVRTRLLGFYFRGAARVYPREVTIEARRRHILWLIENSPDSEASALSEATIDAKGHALADPAGFEQASLLRQAHSVEPNSREWPMRIGTVYALGILGVDMVNQNGLPTSHNAEEVRNAFALRAIDELKASWDATVIGVAGNILGQYGLMLSATYGPDRFAVDHTALSEAFLARARELEPANPRWPSDLEQLRKLRSAANPTK